MRKQRGAAVVMALFIIVLCTLTISPLIWTLFATAKSVSVQTKRTQAEEVSKSGLDWARVILREDARVSATDTLTEPWAVPLAESRISEGLMRQDQDARATGQDREVILTGKIDDAQGRFNLRNLGADSPKRVQWLLAFEKLCGALDIQPTQRRNITEILARMFPKPSLSGETDASDPSLAPMIPARRWEEFKNNYGVDEATWSQLRPYVAILPRFTVLNVNTAPTELIFSSIEDLTYGDAERVVELRNRASFRNLGDLRSAIRADITINNDLLSVNSNFFLVEGTAQVEEAVTRTKALLERRDRRVYVVWRQ